VTLFLTQAIYSLNSSVVSIKGDPLVCLDKDKKDITSTVNMTEAKAKEKELSDAYDAVQYQRERANLYPDIGDQLDALWKGGDDETAMKVIVDKVKTDFPKP
tara:strand:- start:13 stop:318 length:306 start_codon:yes stop_codon:yes gene_type:complete